MSVQKPKYSIIISGNKIVALDLAISRFRNGFNGVVPKREAMSKFSEREIQAMDDAIAAFERLTPEPEIRFKP